MDSIHAHPGQDYMVGNTVTILPVDNDLQTGSQIRINQADVAGGLRIGY